MKRPDKTSTYLLHRRYSPGIMLYTSPTFSALTNFGGRTTTGRPYTSTGHQRSLERPKRQEQH